ncbi:MAG: site-specific DNA-methyltransferase, partial [Leptospiraceae bacterium]|nr:site-specific DNA-methyltransferase [Leptospiraceae bacterium]
QCIYIDPPYGIKFNSNFQWSTTSRDVKDGNRDHVTREPEQVKAFRDTWRDGIHSYLTYLRDRLTVARDLLKDSGSIFVQIGDENVHRVRALMDEVFGEENFVSEVAFTKTTGLGTNLLSSRYDILLWYGKNKNEVKFRRPYVSKSHEEGTASTYSWIKDQSGDYRALKIKEQVNFEIPTGYRLYKPDNITSQGNSPITIPFEGRSYTVKSKTTELGMDRLGKSGRLHKAKNSIQYVRFLDDFSVVQVSNLWGDTGTGGFTDEKVYVVQTGSKTIQRCILMTTDPGDLVLDPTCGSGTTATVCEQWGRRWITVDTSRVALAIARSRIMGARYPYYLLADSKEGLQKEAEVSRTTVKDRPVKEDIRQGFVYERVPHITLKSIANNAEIDVIYDKWQETLEPLRADLNKELAVSWEEWQIPRELKTKSEAEKERTGKSKKSKDDTEWPVKISDKAKKLHEKWWEARIARQKEIDASIAAQADQEYLYDRPYEDKSKVRVAGPFTVESLSPHRMLVVDADGEVIDPLKKKMPQAAGTGDAQDFVQMVLDNLLTAGVQQAEKSDRLEFHSLNAWPGEYVCAEGNYSEGNNDRRAGVFVGPEFGTVSRSDLVAAAREAADAGFDVLIACAFNFDAHASEFDKLGKVPVLKARMNPDLHMSSELKNTGQGNLFVVFGEPDIEILPVKGGAKNAEQIQVKVHGIDVFKPQTGEIVSGDADSIALWFIDTDYNEESFFVRQAYFLGANDPYKALKTTLKAEINEDAWSTLNSDVSRQFAKPEGGRIAVKVINHLG